jgi:hypothetical protein
MTEYQKTYIELKKQFVATNEGPDSVRALYPELKMLTDAVASSKIISAKKSEELVQKLCRLTSLHQAKQLQKFAALYRFVCG